MHSFERINGQHQYTGALPQTACHFSHNASSSWSANNMHQYMNANSGLQQSQGANIAFHNVVSANGQMPNRQGSEGLHLAANLSNNNLKGCNRMLPGDPTNTSNSFPSPTCGPQIVTLQYSHSNYANQSLASYSSPTTTYHLLNQTAAGNEAQTSRIQNASHLQQNQPSHSLHQFSTGYVSPYATSTRSLPYQQMVNPGSSTSAASQNVQTYQVAHYNSAQQCSSYTRVQNVSNTRERSQQARTQPNSSYYTCEGPTNSRNTNLNKQYTYKHTYNPFLRKTNEVPINYNAQQQMVRNQLNQSNLAKSSTVRSGYQLPPSYESHIMSNNSRLSNQTMQPVTSTGSQSCNLSATQPLSLHSVQTLPQGVMPTGPLTVNPPLQQNTLPVGFTVNTAGGMREGEKAVNVSLPSNNTVSKSCPAGFQTEGPSDLSSARINKINEYLKHYPRLIKILGYSPTVQPNDDSAQPVPTHSVTRAVAVVLPLSQEDGRASSYTPTCNPKNITDVECITPEVTKEAALVEEESNLEQEDPNPVRVNNTVASDGAVVTIPDSESPSSSQSSEQDSLGPTAQKCSDIPPSQTLPEEQSEVTKPPSPPVLELSSIPTITWTMDSLNGLLETEKAQVKPSENPKHSTIYQILCKFWNLDIKACCKAYKKWMESNYDSYISLLCKHIPKDHVILTQVNKDHLKQYNVLKDDDVYSEQPYKSLWLNVNDQLDDIDKEFGFPWTLMQHLYVHETCSQMKPVDDIPELVAHEVQNRVSSQLTPETVDLTDNDEEALAVATPPVPSEDTSSDLNYSFKLDVLPPEEARAIYEKVQNPVYEDPDFEDVMEVSGSLQPKLSNDMDATAKSSTKNKPEQMQVICCFAKFMQIHSLAASSSLKCMCKQKPSHNESIVRLDLENSPKDTDNETITLSSPEHCLKIDQIIDLTNVDDDLYSYYDQASETSDGIWLNIVSSSDVEDTEFISTEPEGASENVNLAIAETQSEDETLKGEVKSTDPTQSCSSVSNSTQTEHEELCSSETKYILQTSDHEENCEQAEEAESCLENEGQTQITNTSFSLHVKEKPNEGQKRRSSLEQFFPGPSTPSKPQLPTASSISCATQSEHEELCSSEAEDVLQISEHEENREQTEEACLENEGQTQISHQTFFSLRDKEKTNEERQKRQSSLEEFFPGPSTPKKLKLPTSPVLLDVPEAQPEVSEIKTLKLALFGSRKRRNCVLSGNRISPTSTSGSPKPPEILSFKMDQSTRKPTGSGLTGNYSVKPFLYQVWKNSIPTLNGSIKNGRINKLKRQTRLHVSESSKGSEEEQHSVSDRKHKGSLSLKKRRKRGRYGVTVCQPANHDPEKKQDGDVHARPLKDNIVLKFSILSNTFDFKNGSNEVMEAPGPESDETKVEKKDQHPGPTKHSKGTWYSTPGKLYQPLVPPNKGGLFHEYQQKYKEKTRSFSDT
uniref:Uncharacterized protein n=2 Tax=Iconisemion striatum TaxID=60296 RepID=A0A1A7WUJ1_9TELE